MIGTSGRVRSTHQKPCFDPDTDTDTDNRLVMPSCSSRPQHERLVFQVLEFAVEQKLADQARKGRGRGETQAEVMLTEADANSLHFKTSSWLNGSFAYTSRTMASISFSSQTGVDILFSLFVGTLPYGNLVVRRSISFEWLRHPCCRRLKWHPRSPAGGQHRSAGPPGPARRRVRPPASCGRKETVRLR